MHAVRRAPGLTVLDWSVTPLSAPDRQTGDEVPPGFDLGLDRSLRRRHQHRADRSPHRRRSTGRSATGVASRPTAVCAPRSGPLRPRCTSARPGCCRWRTRRCPRRCASSTSWRRPCPRSATCRSVAAGLRADGHPSGRSRPAAGARRAADRAAVLPDRRRRGLPSDGDAAGGRGAGRRRLDHRPLDAAVDERAAGVPGGAAGTTAGGGRARRTSPSSAPTPPVDPPWPRRTAAPCRPAG